MSIDTPPSRTGAPDPTKLDPALANRALVEKHDSVADKASDAADGVLAPLDHFKDTLAGDLTKATGAVEAKTHDIPVLGQVAQFATGALSAAWGMVDGTYNTFRHPVQTVKGLWTMASHVPVVSPMWWVHGFKDGFGKTLEGDGVFWKAVGKGYLEPYAKDWKQGRYFAVAGRASVDIGTLYLGVKNAKAALDGWKARRASAASNAVDEVAKAHPGKLTDELHHAVVGDEPRVTGQVMGEGTTVADETRAMVKIKQSGPKRLVDEELAQVHANRRVRAAERVAGRGKVKFKGERKDLYGRALKTLQRDREYSRQLQLVGPDRLRKDVQVRIKYRKVTASVDARVDRELESILGVKPYGEPKMAERAAAKLSLKQQANGPGFRLGDLDDLARGRIDMPAYDPILVKQYFRKIREYYGDQNLMVNNYMTYKPFYRGRLHVKIRDRSGMWYELQIGPKQLSTFYDTPFKAAGKVCNIHDAVYKGLMAMDDDAFRILGKGSIDLGEQRVATVLDKYVDALDEVMRTAQQGGEYDYFNQTALLRKGIADLLDELPTDKLPIGLRA
jgi:hypothetical protein